MNRDCMAAARRSCGTAALVAWLFLLTNNRLSLVHALSSTASYSSMATAACTSPLFRACPPVEGPVDQESNSSLDTSTSSAPYQVTTNRNVPHSSSTTATTTPLPPKPSSKGSSSSSSHSNKINRSALQALGYTPGLCQALEEYRAHTAKRYWIIDDSLSMTKRDGHLWMPTHPHTKESSSYSSSYHHVMEQVPCTRWNELQDTVLHHALLAWHCQIPTDFRLLNHKKAGHFRVPRAGPPQRADVQHAQKLLTRAKPQGVTPLTARLQAVHKELQQSIWPRCLSESSGSGVAVVVATDGLPTGPDGLSTDATQQAFQKALQALATSSSSSSCSIVIRLCTDDVDVVTFYKQLEQQLPPHVLQVLDDYGAEATRVHRYNPWLSYGMPLHRLREMGLCHGTQPSLLKTLSQRPLTRPEVALFCAFLFGWDTSTMASLVSRADEDAGWQALEEAVQEANAQHDLVWNPVTAQMEPWIELDFY